MELFLIVCVFMLVRLHVYQTDRQRRKRKEKKDKHHTDTDIHAGRRMWKQNTFSKIIH